MVSYFLVRRKKRNDDGYLLDQFGPYDNINTARRAAHQIVSKSYVMEVHSSSMDGSNYVGTVTIENGKYLWYNDKKVKYLVRPDGTLGTMLSKKVPAPFGL